MRPLGRCTPLWTTVACGCLVGDGERRSRYRPGFETEKRPQKEKVLLVNDLGLKRVHVLLVGAAALVALVASVAMMGDASLELPVT